MTPSISATYGRTFVDPSVWEGTEYVALVPSPGFVSGALLSTCSFVVSETDSFVSGRAVYPLLP